MDVINLILPIISIGISIYAVYRTFPKVCVKQIPFFKGYGDGIFQYKKRDYHRIHFCLCISNQRANLTFLESISCKIKEMEYFLAVDETIEPFSSKKIYFGETLSKLFYEEHEVKLNNEKISRKILSKKIGTKIKLDPYIERRLKNVIFIPDSLKLTSDKGMILKKKNKNQYVIPININFSHRVKKLNLILDYISASDLERKKN